ncbi:hypothetical protein WJX75_000593 [Coccomyxa subellipsoidea]|uniref:NAD(P)-binding protein n=1 Tax=Coccomyxa subellipsoidea TaxID=248742 RepID=A0ABR2YZ12_9CHLO
MDRRVAVVTGGTRGIGYGISSVLASQQYSLVLGYNSNYDAAKQAKEELETQYGVKVVTVPGDISVPATVIALFQAVKDNFEGHCTAFIHNAGLYVGVTTTSAEAPARLNPDEPWDERVYDYYQKVMHVHVQVQEGALQKLL